MIPCGPCLNFSTFQRSGCDSLSVSSNPKLFLLTTLATRNEGNEYEAFQWVTHLAQPLAKFFYSFSTLPLTKQPTVWTCIASMMTYTFLVDRRAALLHGRLYASSWMLWDWLWMTRKVPLSHALGQDLFVHLRKSYLLGLSGGAFCIFPRENGWSTKRFSKRILTKWSSNSNLVRLFLPLSMLTTHTSNSLPTTWAISAGHWGRNTPD